MALIIAPVVLAALLSLYFFVVLVGAVIAFIPWLIVGLLAAGLGAASQPVRPGEPWAISVSVWPAP